MTATLSEVIAALPGARPVGPVAPVVLTDATHDSRQAGPGVLFCAVVGARADGHDHAPEAVARGAAAVLVERPLDLDIPQIEVPDVRPAMGPAAAIVHRRPSRQLTVVGTTGTNGKTTVSTLLEGAFAAHGVGVGLIGTIETRIHGEAIPGVRTTPEGTDLQRLLRHCHDRGVDAVAMEVSSHGLDLRRVDGTRFAVAVYTNLSQDHLDWHGTMEAYLAAKARLFTPGLSDHGVVFLDGPWADALLERVTIPVTTVGLAPRPQDDGPAPVGSGGPSERTPEVLLEPTAVDTTGSRGRLHGVTDAPLEVATGLPGGFNLVNAALAVVAAVTAGVPAEVAAAGVAAAPGPSGRLERVAAARGPAVFVDYAHTPDAVTAVLDTLRSTLAPGGRLLVVLGCGGERDRHKRGPMGAAAAGADVAVLTSDNPRSEDPHAILATMVSGAREAEAAGAPAELHVEVDRDAAIGRALTAAGPADVVLIAGKGHETVQEFADRTVPFDDRQVAARWLAAGEERP